MIGSKGCPACDSPGRKISGKVVLLQTHRTYGYGERTYTCRKCGTEYSLFYAIPPKSGALPPKPGEPDDGLLRPGWMESVKGHASGNVVGVEIPSERESVAAPDAGICIDD